MTDWTVWHLGRCQKGRGLSWAVWSFAGRFGRPITERQCLLGSRTPPPPPSSTIVSARNQPSDRDQPPPPSHPWLHTQTACEETGASVFTHKPGHAHRAPHTHTHTHTHQTDSKKQRRRRVRVLVKEQDAHTNITFTNMQEFGDFFFLGIYWESPKDRQVDRDRRVGDH